jgi:hypothetical protein
MAIKIGKYTIEEVREVFEKDGYELLSKEYVNCKTKLQYRCPNGHIRETIFDNFKNSGRRCPACAQTEIYTIEYVRQCFKDFNFRLLDTEYTNRSQKLNYVCNNGHTTTIRFGEFQQGKRCGKCLNRDLFQLEDVINYFEEHGCKLRTTEFINMTQDLEYICACGENNIKTFAQFRVCRNCNECRENNRHNIEDVKKLFEDNGCTLLETKYVSNNTKMKYICVCGKESEIVYTNFRRGQRCSDCGQKKKQETLQKHYGVSYPTQSAIIQEKISKTGKFWKEYTMPSSKIVKLQGYENKALDDLLNNGILEDEIDIHCKTINKEFMYYFNGMYRVYLPDFYIPHINTIIEVKSEYIYKKELHQNIQKAKCCIAQGYEFEFWIYENSKKTKNKRILKYNKDFTICL